MPPKKESLLHTLVRFLIRPDYRLKYARKNIWLVLWDIFRLFALAATLSFFLGVVMTILLEQQDYDTSKHAITDLLFKKEAFILIFMGSLWAPITEELTFRLGMKYSPKKLGLSIMFLLLVLLDIWSGIYYGAEPIEAGAEETGPQMIDVIFSLIFFLGAAGLGLVLGQYFKERLDTKTMEKFYTRYFLWIFYGVSVFFALIHLLNFEDIGQIWYWFPFLIAPQFVIGLILGFIRMRYGLKWSIIYHAFHNSIFMIPLIFVFYFFVTEELLQAAERDDFQAIENLIAANPAMQMGFGLLGLGVLLLGSLILFSLGHLAWEAITVRRQK